MRTPSEINAELATIKKPNAKFGTLKRMIESLQESKAWRWQNPVESQRCDELFKELEESERQQEEARRAEAVLSNLRSSGVGGRTVDSLSDVEETEALMAVRRWATEGVKTWLLICGPVGTGKTVAAAWEMQNAARASRSVAFRRAGELARLSGFDEGARQLTHLKDVSLLVVDDMGTECSTAWGQSVLHELFDYRHEAKLKTILTSNFKQAEARERLGDRMSDRIQGDGKIVWLEGKSMRVNR